MENKPLQRIKAILEVALAVTESNPNEETFYFYNIEKKGLRSWPKSPLFEDHQGLMTAFKKINKGTRDNVTVEYSGGDSMKASDFDNFNTGPGKYILHVDDRIELKRYFDEVMKELSSIRHQFVLKVSTPKSLLYVKSKPDLKFEIVTDTIQYKLLHFLAEEKTPVATSRLLTKLNMKSRQVTTAIDQLRKKLVDEMGIDRNNLFENDSDSGTGYKVDNVSIIVE